MGAIKIQSNRRTYTNSRTKTEYIGEQGIWENTNKFSIPGMGNDLTAFLIHGNSMSPTIEQGEMAICVKLESLDQIQDNSIYAIVLEGKIYVKRIIKTYNEFNNVTHLTLVSDNAAEYPPFMVSVDVVREGYLVRSKLSNSI